MRAPSLRTQFGIVAVFLGLHVFAVVFAYWLRSQAQARLTASLERDLTFLGGIAAWRSAIERLDHATEHYLLTGDRRWLDIRSKLKPELAELYLSGPPGHGSAGSGAPTGFGPRSETAGARPRFDDPREPEIWSDYLERYLRWMVRQEDLISRKSAGRLDSSEVAAIAERETREIAGMLGALEELREVNTEEVRRSRLAVQRASTMTLIAVSFAGLATSALLLLFLSRFIFRPLKLLGSQAQNWTLGRPWDMAEPSGNPEIVGLYRRIRDMSVRLNQEYEKEKELSRLKSDIVSMVSHEFNNALNIIQGVSRLLEGGEGRETPVERRRLFAMLESNIRSLGLAAKNLLNMGRLESGRFALRLAPMDLLSLLNVSIQHLEGLAVRKKIAVSTEFPPGEVSVEGDFEALTLVATNLLSNAIKYTPERGSVTVGVIPHPREPRRVLVYFQDTGIGISKEDQARIFESFYRTESGRQAAGGFGVGLSLAKQILDAHGLSLEVASVPGKGSRFSFDLPLVETTSR